jgi:urease accessory protein
VAFTAELEMKRVESIQPTDARQAGKLEGWSNGAMDKRKAALLQHSNTPTLLSLALFAAFLVSASSAHAHIARGEAGGFGSGFHHPWSGFDHILAMLAVGIWGAQLGAPAIWLLPVVFPMIMACGGFLGLIGVHLPGVEIGIALSALLLGAMVCGEVRPPLFVAALLVGVFGLFHGHAHGTELPPGQNGLLYSMGFVIATGCLHGLGIALGLIHKWRFGKIALRTAGAAISIGGIIFLTEALK